MAVGEDEIRSRFEELSKSITHLWSMMRGASLAATASTLRASLESKRLVQEGRMLIPEAAATQNPLELAMASPR